MCSTYGRASLFDTRVIANQTKVFTSAGSTPNYCSRCIYLDLLTRVIRVCLLRKYLKVVFCRETFETGILNLKTQRQRTNTLGYFSPKLVTLVCDFLSTKWTVYQNFNQTAISFPRSWSENESREIRAHSTKAWNEIRLARSLKCRSQPLRDIYEGHVITKLNK